MWLIWRRTEAVCVFAPRHILIAGVTPWQTWEMRINLLLLQGAHLNQEIPAVVPELLYVNHTHFWRIILAQWALRSNYCNSIGVFPPAPWKNPVITIKQWQCAHIARWQNSCVMNVIQKHLSPAQTHSVRASSAHLSQGVRSDTWNGWLSTHPPTSSQGFSLPSRSGYRVHQEPWK